MRPRRCLLIFREIEEVWRSWKGIEKINGNEKRETEYDDLMIPAGEIEHIHLEMVSFDSVTLTNQGGTIGGVEFHVNDINPVITP